MALRLAILLGMTKAARSTTGTSIDCRCFLLAGLTAGRFLSVVFFLLLLLFRFVCCWLVLVVAGDLFFLAAAAFRLLSLTFLSTAGSLLELLELELSSLLSESSESLNGARTAECLLASGWRISLS